MANKITKLKSIDIKNFRGLSGVSLDIADRITIVCGKNGTSKSTILGIIAQVFSFKKDYSANPPENLKFKTLTDVNFESVFSDHFRFSKHDEPGSMDIGFVVYDGASDTTQSELKLRVYDVADRDKVRPVVRGNKIEGVSNTSRNITHPVIYLSLARLQPITTRKEYSVRNEEYIRNNSDYFKGLNNKILIKTTSTLITATSGSIKSVVGHANYYDQDSVSVGEDNVGQILQALLSFKKLKEEYKNYHGGILLIDEADAGLFPAAQLEFIKLLTRITKELNLQVVMTSHSPTMIEEVYKLSKASKDYRTIYLTDTYGKIKVKNDLSWPQIYADLHVDTVKVKDDYFPKVNVYFEDLQGFDLYNAIITKSTLKKIIHPLKDINISCSDLISLVKRKIPEFSAKSIIVLDADVKEDKNYKDIQKQKNVILLPSSLPPDQLLFEFLCNLEPDDAYWENDTGFTKAVFERAASDIYNKLNITVTPGVKVNLQNYIDQFRNRPEYQKGQVREMFKQFSKKEKILEVVDGKVSINPYRYWAKKNPDLAGGFLDRFISGLIHVLVSGYGLEVALVTPRIQG
ncbi:ATP-dependent nuclease [Klebsiella oxytoca]|uniref:ATP-dependent nuclease n=1 Tax=Klebsiella oxytoca TaxID=571 RepID=UPI00254ECD54|nr:AAA family ATPase [Klebsiella oxytoca]